MTTREGPWVFEIEWAEAGDLAVDVGAYDFKATPPGGKPVHEVGKYATVFKKTDAGWRIVVDTWNSDPPTPAKGK